MKGASHGSGDTVRELVVVQQCPSARRSLHPIDPERATGDDVDRLLQRLAVAEAHRRGIEAIESKGGGARVHGSGVKERLVDGHVESALVRLVDEEAETQR
jgi:hypothetical protein